MSLSEVRKKTFRKLEVCCELVILYIFNSERDGIGLYTQSIDPGFIEIKVTENILCACFAYGSSVHRLGVIESLDVVTSL